ncbi:MAG: putative 4-hydroxybenzoate polyprenyltransferase [Bacteroidales bacterium]|nr:putative 4-hydroxybenzoate polyprenyltransferase [Bacteroidales bacterium]
MNLKKIPDYLNLVKFAHTIFAFPFAMLGYFLGLQSQNWKFEPMILLLIILCMIFARSAAMSFNRIADLKFDKENPRTQNRELPKEVLKIHSALIFSVASSLLFVATTFFINKICFYLSPVALIIILGYSYTKRFTSLCHIILGLGLSLSPIGAYLAATGNFGVVPLLLSFSVLFWVSGFDIIYALQDKDFDLKNDLFSIPASCGIKNAIKISAVLHLLSSVLLIITGIYGEFGMFYWTGTLIFILCIVYQHRLVKPDDLSKVNFAFFTMNGIASIVFAAFVIVDILI